MECVRLTAAHEAIVFGYQSASSQTLAFVINGIRGAVNPAAPPGRHLSSTQPPTVFRIASPYPVLVMDPRAGRMPFLFM
ncbi:hypothetical protein FLP10_10405 [Agromyces intestinalis]|uniref:Uncharacterized protein n=1 Tax=Agromyces intestinalis TaxID=2592652 RepID=A0A5C1YFB9_9MICO|nr:hypothetical protein FLP10_10405 [Agromyces intestinalis]